MLYEMLFGVMRIVVICLLTMGVTARTVDGGVCGVDIVTGRRKEPATVTVM